MTWFFNDQPLPTNDRLQVTETDDGTSILTIRQAKLADEGVYTARAINAFGETEAHTTLKIDCIKPIINTNLNTALKVTKVTYAVVESPMFIVKPTTQKVRQGETAVFVSNVDGYPTPIITWLLNGKLLTAKEGVEMQFDATTDQANLSIQNVDLEQHAGSITCRVENEYGDEEETVQLDILVAPTIIEDLPKQQETVSEQDVTLKLIVRGAPRPSAQWFFKDRPIGSENASVDEAKNEYQLLIKQSTVALSEGTYRVVLKNEVGEVQSTPCVLTVLESVKLTKVKPASIPLRASSPDIHPNAKWSQNGITVAGGNGYGCEINQLHDPCGLYINDDQTIYVADSGNHRIVEWKSGATNGKVVTGENGHGNKAHQLSYPVDVIVDKERDSFIISDHRNQRVVRWPRQNGASRETIISNISCWGLTMDENGSLYVVEWKKHEVRRYKIGGTEETVVAGGNGYGNHLDQLSNPHYVFVDRDHSLYMSDFGNHRVMKWEQGAKHGIVVASNQGQGNNLTQLNRPQGVVVDQLGTVYVADYWNHRIIRWLKGATQESVIIGGNGQGARSNQLSCPIGLSFDRYGNLYVVDHGNHRVQKFNIE
ncbi:unnamed protein product [Rotaria sp. Silwood1]|nr:unnamed protein product [Rotaria sp. Silwood1]